MQRSTDCAGSRLIGYIYSTAPALSPGNFMARRQKYCESKTTRKSTVKHCPLEMTEKLYPFYLNNMAA